jgi:hypothetical protein
MLKKLYSPQQRICQVYFRIEPHILNKSLSASNAGDLSTVDTSGNLMCILACFTDWKPIPMKQRSDGSYSIAYTLEGTTKYQFRYLFDKTYWIEEPDCDGTESNPFGSKNCVLQT